VGHLDYSSFFAARARFGFSAGASPSAADALATLGLVVFVVASAAGAVFVAFVALGATWGLGRRGRARRERASSGLMPGDLPGRWRSVSSLGGSPHPRGTLPTETMSLIRRTVSSTDGPSDPTLRLRAVLS
jgi:hypothetical protein